MNSKGIIKAQYLALQPNGLMGVIDPGSDEDQMYEGLSEDLGIVRDFFVALSFLRNPHGTPILEDLEYEYGIPTDKALTLEERKAQLASLVYAKKSNGDLDGLKSALAKAGFDVYVEDGGVYSSVPDAEVIANGDAFDQHVGLSNTCTDSLVITSHSVTCSGPPDAPTCGAFEDVKTEKMYDPMPAQYATYNIAKNSSLEKLDIPASLRVSFRRIVLRYKPLGTWALLYVNWISSEDFDSIQDTLGESEIYQDALGASDIIQSRLIT